MHELTPGHISTILYIMESYLQGNDEYDTDPEFARDCDQIFAILENV